MTMINQRIQLPVAFGVFLLLTTVSANEETVDSLDATHILERMAKTYAECNTYRDSGMVTTVFISGDDRRTIKKPFKTAFVRPTKFRFEYRENKLDGEDYVYIVYRDEHGTKTWWDVSEKEESEVSLDMALGGATGVSSGSAHTIPILLLPDEVSGRRLTSLSKARRVEDRECMSSACYRIEGKYAGNPAVVWVDKQTFLVRRIDSRSEFDNFRTERTTLYDPVIDLEVDNELLEFNSPESR